MKKLSKEHQKFVDECAMRAMQGLITSDFWNGRVMPKGAIFEEPVTLKDFSDYCAEFSSLIASSMLEEKIKREKLDD